MSFGSASSCTRAVSIRPTAAAAVLSSSRKAPVTNVWAATSASVPPELGSFSTTSGWVWVTPSTVSLTVYAPGGYRMDTQVVPGATRPSAPGTM